MLMSVRSYLTVGTVAVVGAGAIALAPALPASGPVAMTPPPPVVADVELSALSLSLSDVLGLLQNFGIGGPLPGLLTALPSLLPSDIVSAVVTEFVGRAAPIVITAATEVFGYLGTAVTGLFIGPDSIPVRFGAALANIPTVLVSAVGSLATGDIATALATITTGLAAPVTGISQAIADATAAVQTYLATQFNGLLGVLPGVLFSAVQTVLSGNLQSLIDSIGGALSGFFGGLFPAAASVRAPAAAAAAVVPAPLSVSAPAAVPAPLRDAVTNSTAVETARSVRADSVRSVPRPAAAADATTTTDATAPTPRDRSVPAKSAEGKAVSVRAGAANHRAQPSAQ